MICLSLIVVLQLLCSTFGFSLFARSPVSIGPIVSSNNTIIRLPSNSSEPKMVVSFINGIYHTLDDWNRITNQLRETFNAEVKPFYNPSSGYWLADFSNAGYELLRRSNDFANAKSLSKHLRDLLKEVGPEGRVLHIAHSGGAILTYIAAKYHLTHSERNQIDIITFGAGHSITHRYFKGYVRNYYAKNDPVMNVDSQAMKLYRQFASCPSASVAPRIRVVESNYNTSYYFLTGLTGNPMKDHSMEEPTYRHILMEEAKDFDVRRQKLREGSLGSRKRRSWSSALRKRAARLTGWHHFWGRMRAKSDDVRDYAKLTASIPAVLVKYPDSNSQLTTNFMRSIRKALARWTGWHRVFSNGSSVGNQAVIDFSIYNATWHQTQGNMTSSISNISSTLISSDRGSKIKGTDASQLLPTLTYRENSTMAHIASHINEGLEQLDFWMHSADTSGWLQSLNQGAKQLINWTQPAVHYVTTSLVNDVSSGLTAAAAALPSVLMRNDTHSATAATPSAGSAAPVVEKEFNYSIAVEDVQLPEHLRAYLLTSAHKHCQKQFTNASNRAHLLSRQQLEEDILNRWQRTANLAKLIAAREESVSQKVAYVSCALRECVMWEAGESMTSYSGFNKTMRALVPSFLSGDELHLVFDILKSLNQSSSSNNQTTSDVPINETESRAIHDKRGEYRCVHDSIVLASHNVQDLLNKSYLSQRAVAQNSTNTTATVIVDELMDQWEAELLTESGRQLMRQRRNLLRASMKEQYLEDLLNSQKKWEVDVD